MKKITCTLFVTLLLLVSVFPNQAFAQTDSISQPESLEAQVVGIVEEKELEVMDKKQLYQKLELLVKTGSLQGQEVTAENGNIPLANAIKFKVGDQVVLNLSKGMEGENVFQITDYVRRSSLYLLFAIFVVLTLLIGRVKGLTSLLGMGLTFAVVFVFLVPQILSGADPIWTSILASMMIIPLSFYLSHGLNQKTTVAIIGTIFALVATGILANIFVELAHLSGFVSEEAGFLQTALQGTVNIKGLLLAGIIIGALGVLDDVTVSQAAVVRQLQDANRDLNPGELYKRAMNVGRDHIASMVNTLVLVYTGASLPLLLLFVNNPHPFSEVINYEIITNEIIRTLVGSIGLILAVPITTFIAAILAKSSSALSEKDSKTPIFKEAK